MNCLPTSNLYLSTDFVHNYGFFLQLKTQHSAQSFSSTPYLRLCKKCYSVASNSSISLRRTTNYQPSLWDDSQIQSLNTTSFTVIYINVVQISFSSCFYYISNVSTQGDVHEKRREKLKEDVKRLIKEKSFADQLELFDSLQKLGVAYHFEEEIKYLLNLMKCSEEKLRMEFTEDVHVMALYFRLSREHGFEVSKDLLVKSYKDEKGFFKPYVFHDIKGLLSLYEASFLSMDGEDEIDEAKEFALKHLNDCMRSNSTTNPLLAKHIALALELPLHHRIQKLQAPMFIEHARNMKELDVDPILFEFAQLDFNMTQSIYNRELKEITRWWAKISNLAGGELSFAREWPLESYFLAVGLAIEPYFSTCRKEFAKAICFINVIDDIYDIYGSLDELQHFTDAVERWDFATSKSLPQYMKICLSELFNTVNSLACKIMKDKGLDILPYLKRAVKLLKLLKIFKVLFL
ncbi:Alpha-terpineol synthase, chloroplastic [Dendrobium catenatum]|uniref:Alpha-terpineol synthase, chloroplastic n=1 Tax=Dendrobium catenatum TaxID=906689 RepID=A0A2I0WUS6_9ASPA|nr:Alpha-terpineol synthase, chloroplastic [Dendrobium catenatum]